MISVKALKKRFGTNEVLKGIDLNVNKGDVISVLGPSGSGKTTLLRCMNFLEKADSGLFDFDGEEYDLASITKKQIAAVHLRTAFVFQNYNLFRNMTALKNVTEGLTVARKMPVAEAKEIAYEMLKKVGMYEKRDSYPSELSGGQQQRVAIARALAVKPEIIYFDEPTSALDPELIGEVLTVIRQLADEGMTMIIVTHEMAFARSVSTYGVFMEDGIIQEEGPAASFFNNPQNKRTSAFMRGFEIK